MKHKKDFVSLERRSGFGGSKLSASIKYCKLPTIFRRDDELFVDRRMSFCATPEGYVQFFYEKENRADLVWTLFIDSCFSKFEYYISNFAQSNINPFLLASSIFLLQHSLIHNYGIIIHAAGGSVLNKGIAFAAPSRTGKSTLSCLLQLTQNRLFSEDRLIIRLMDNCWQLWGTPWPGSGGIARNESIPLSALVFLRQSEGTKISRLPPSEGLHRLLQVVSIPWYSAEWTNKGLAVCEALIQSVPMFELAFRPDQTVVRVIEEFISILD